ncbi:hypothetical protein BBJ28_00002207 [Nothophytophthora sp. Chile5]|nr:hypothetical protein BBJ28_00002207 [Nothophytophthora sp. Chile5]
MTTHDGTHSRDLHRQQQDARAASSPPAVHRAATPAPSKAAVDRPPASSPYGLSGRSVTSTLTGPAVASFDSTTHRVPVVNSVLDRPPASSPHGTSGRSATSTPTRPTVTSSGSVAYRAPIDNPVLDKKREARHDSHRALLKSSSDYNRAEMKYVALEAELRLAEFWLEVMTKNLEDVGKRIEVHDWNFQKAAEQDEYTA